jgi:hypothetical protein
MFLREGSRWLYIYSYPQKAGMGEGHSHSSGAITMTPKSQAYYSMPTSRVAELFELQPD